MNTPESSKSDPGRPPPRTFRTPLISERYNMTEPPLGTRLERMQSTPRLRLKSAPKIVKSEGRRSCGGRGVMGSLHAEIVSTRNNGNTLHPLYNRDDSRPYVDQVFTQENEIGMGSFGRVFRMKDRQTGRHYAVKCATEPYRNNRNRKEKHHEVMMHERVPKHENLVEFICAWEEQDLLYIQTELCEMSLENHLHKYAPLPEWRIWDVFLDLAKAVHHLDTLNLIHADIKPANVLVSFDGVCKLGDFGLMVDLQTDDLENDTYEGDSKYLAQEVLNSTITKEATIFSLGLSILQIATDLHLPSSGPRWHDIRKLDIPKRFTERLTPDLVDFIYRMMAINPLERPTISAILNSPLLREHDTGYRQWNRRFYFLFRNFYTTPLAGFPKLKGT